jgi:hypothetical protein
MTRSPYDDGIGINGLRGVGWVLGVVAVGSFLRLLTYAANGTPVQTELFVWVLLGTISAVFSASCAVIAGIKSAELRLARLARVREQTRTHESRGHTEIK